jgi:hypothetical protein
MRVPSVLLLAVAAGAVVPAAALPQSNSAPTPSRSLPTSWEEPMKLDGRGYIRQWLILGPINFGDKYNADDIDKDQIKDESQLMPRPGDKVRVATEEGQAGSYKTVQKELTWKGVKTESFSFDLNQIFHVDDSTGMGAYAVSYLDAPEELTGVKFSLGSNDDCKIFLNGKKVHLFVGGRGLDEDSDVVPDLTLHKGINVVIFKVWNDANNWEGCLRLLTKDDKPLTPVTVRLPK